MYLWQTLQKIKGAVFLHWIYIGTSYLRVRFHSRGSFYWGCFIEGNLYKIFSESETKEQVGSHLFFYKYSVSLDFFRNKKPSFIFLSNVKTSKFFQNCKESLFLSGWAYTHHFGLVLWHLSDFLITVVSLFWSI